MATLKRASCWAGLPPTVAAGASLTAIYRRQGRTPKQQLLLQLTPSRAGLPAAPRRMPCRCGPRCQMALAASGHCACLTSAELLDTPGWTAHSFFSLLSTAAVRAPQTCAARAPLLLEPPSARMSKPPRWTKEAAGKKEIERGKDCFSLRTGARWMISRLPHSPSATRHSAGPHPPPCTLYCQLPTAAGVQPRRRRWFDFFSVAAGTQVSSSPRSLALRRAELQCAAGGLGLGAQSQRSGGYLRGNLIGHVWCPGEPAEQGFGELEAPMPAAPSAHWCGIPRKIATTSPVSRLLGVRACSSREVGPPRHRAARLWTRTAAPAAPSHPNWPGYRVFERPVGAGLARTAVSSTRISRLGQSDARQGPVGGQEPEVRPSQRSADLVTARRPAPPARLPAPACPPRRRSGFGHQCTSNKPSSPGFGFGSSGRDAFQKVARRAGRWVAGQYQAPFAPRLHSAVQMVHTHESYCHTLASTLSTLPPCLQQYASAEVDKAKVKSQGGDNPLGAAYNVPASRRHRRTACTALGGLHWLLAGPTCTLKSLAPAPAQCPHFYTNPASTPPSAVDH